MRKRKPIAPPVRWMEMIKVRTNRPGNDELHTRILEHLEQIRQATGDLQIHIHLPISVPNDVLVVLRWYTEPMAEGSDLAYSLCRELKAFGLVDHSVWKEPVLMNR